MRENDGVGLVIFPRIPNKILFGMKSEIEIFRIISAFGIVWFHSGIEYGRDIAYGGLIFFIIISVYFSITSTRVHTFTERAQRLILPYIIWQVFYGVVKIATKGAAFLHDSSMLSVFFVGAALHLWFLPFIFFVLIAIDKLHFLLLKKAWLATLIGILAMLSILFSPLWRGFDYPLPLGQYMHAMPAVFIGIFLGACTEFKIKLALMIGIILSMLLMVFTKQPGIGVPYLTGFIPCCFLFTGYLKTNQKPLLQYVAAATFGVYLLHPFALKIMKYVGVVGFFLPTGAFFLSFLAILIFRTHMPKNIVKYFI